MRLLDFLKSVGTMMGTERLESEQGTSYAEFTYQHQQGSDFMCLFENKGVNVQDGRERSVGKHSSGNRAHPEGLAGRRGVRVDNPAVVTKFGKSKNGAIWLSPSMLSPYKFYRYFFNVPNADVVRFLKVLTFLDLEEIDRQDGNMERPGYLPDISQRRLAEAVTRFVHRDDGLQDALRPGAETKLDWKAFEGITEDLPLYTLTYEEVLNASVVDLCVASGLLLSKWTARRLLKQGGLYLNNCRENSENSFEADNVVDGESPAAIGRRKEQGSVRIS